LSKPLISVLTAVYPLNNEYLLAAWKSLNEGNADIEWEWLIQIDGKEQSLPREIMLDSRVRIASNGYHFGAAVTRNFALTRTTTPFIQNLDSYDYLLPGTLSVLYEALVAEPNAVLAFGKDVEIFEDGTTGKYQGGLLPGIIKPGHVYKKWLTLNFPPIHPAGVMWRKSALLAYGAWAALPAGEDTAALIAATQVHPSVFVDRETFAYRRHRNQLSASAEFLETAGYKTAFIKQRARLLADSNPLWSHDRTDFNR
jgi:hypothetical protein